VRIGKSLIVLAGAAAVALWAQTPAFEVASVKVNRSDDGISRYPTLTNGVLSAKHATLKMILQTAYGLGALQIGGPGWLDSDRFDLEAKSPQGVPESDMMPMLQSLLRERFKLMAHRESKEMPVYDLIVAKDGLKIPLFDPAHIPATPPRNGAASMIIGPMTMSQLASQMTPAAGRPVLDRTGLDGRYFCALTFSPLSAEETASTADSGPLDLFVAVQRQLGLKLEPAKEPLEVLMVDHAERVPTEN
jgi:uncharacterized protein (TIGR03435 family)